MLYRFLNKIIENKIEKLRPMARKFLKHDLSGPSKEAASERLGVDGKYLLLADYFKRDQKRKYMVNRNYLNFLKAIIYLYKNSSASIRAGIFMAPPEVYSAINSVQKSFDETVAALNI
jgi:hypothetical protein